MSILDRIGRDMVEAARARDAGRLGAIRYVRSEAKNLEIQLGRDLTDDDCIAVLSRLVKQHHDALEQFEGAGREDLAEKERVRLAVFEAYLPEQIGEDELRELVVAAVEETGATGPGDMGNVMKVVMPGVVGRADGKIVSDLVRTVLAGLDVK